MNELIEGAAIVCVYSAALVVVCGLVGWSLILIVGWFLDSWGR